MHHFSSIRSKLAAYGLDAIMLTEQYNRFYAADFPSTGTDGLALITRNRNYYFTDSRYTVAAQRHVKDAVISITAPGRGYVELVNEVIENEDIRKLGFDEGYMTVADFRRYEGALKAELLPATALMTGLRVVKDEEELNRLRHAQRIADKALTETMPMIRPGVTEKEVAAYLTYRLLASGAENVSFDPIVVSGENGAMPHGVPSEKKIQDGEFVTIDFGALKDGYCSDTTRTFAVGHVTEEMEKVYNTVLKAQTTAIAATRAGMTGKEIDGIARKIIADAGYGEYFGHGYGHGVGVQIHEGPNVNARNDQPMPTGSVTSAEPGIYLPGKFGVRIEDVVILREDGYEDLTSLPKELTIL